MDEIGDEFNDSSGDDEAEEELLELTSESDELGEFDDDIPETFSEPDEFDDDIPDVFSEPDEFDDDIPDVFSEPDEFDDDIPDVFSEPDEFDDDIPDVFSEPDEFDDIIPDVFSETDDILNDAIQDKEGGERADEDQDSGDVGNIIESEIIGPSSNTSVLIGETVAKKEEVWYMIHLVKLFIYVIINLTRLVFCQLSLRLPCMEYYLRNNLT